MTNYEVGDVIIKDITLSNKNTKAEINPSDQISAIDIYEDFNSPTLYAEITFDDKIGLINDFPIIGEELFEITFQTPGLSYPTTYKFNTYALSDVQQQMNGKGYTYTLKCVSKEQLTQSYINIVHSYNETINDIVDNIFTRYLETEKIVDIDPCKGNETIVFPKVTPFTAIDIVRKRAVHPKYFSSSFVFFENQDGFNFKCIEQMMEDGKEKIGSKKFYYFNNGQKDKNTEALMFRSIIEYENIGRTDLTDIIQEGGIKNRVKTFDIFSKKVSDITFDMTEKFSSMVGSDKKNTLNISESTIKDFANEPTFNFFIPKDTNRKENFLENMMGARLAYQKLFNSNFVRAYIPGDSSIKAGDVIELNLPKATGTTENRGTDDLVDGNYIVTRLRHNITTVGKTKHYISMDCNKVGLG
jgi:hypothetical protein